MKITATSHRLKILRAALLLSGAGALFIMPVVVLAGTPAAAQASFATPQDAVDALVTAVKADDSKTLLSILGPDGEPLVHSGDPVADAATATKFLDSYGEDHSLAKQADGSEILSVGTDAWPLPIPLVEAGGKWTFDSADGVQQIVDRRIGSNELLTIQTLYSIVDGEQDYFARQQARTGTGVYAAHVFSTPGTEDGLYWDVTGDETPSPLAPLIAQAQDEGYLPADTAIPDSARQSPYHGYFFHNLKAQGPDAPSGAETYKVDGKMTGGFAFIAWPANYGVTGIMTFIINQDGIAFQKDLGPDTASEAAKITAFNPDYGWTEIVPTN